MSKAAPQQVRLFLSAQRHAVPDDPEPEARKAEGADPVQRRKAVLKAVTSEYPNTKAISVICMSESRSMARAIASL
jgi:hypothetical protein